MASVISIRSHRPVALQRPAGRKGLRKETSHRRDAAADPGAEVWALYEIFDGMHRASSAQDGRPQLSRRS